MRRKDREMDVDFARMVLDKCEYAVLGMAGPEGWPYNVPVTIVRRGEELFSTVPWRAKSWTCCKETTACS